MLKAGLDRFIDYESEDFSALLQKGEVDHVLDTVGGAVLEKSILLKPKSVVTLKHSDASSMHKAGLKLPLPFQWLLKAVMHRYVRLAKVNGVVLIGQVTGANGDMLQRAIDLVSRDFIAAPIRTRSLSDISSTGLSPDDLGKAIEF